MDTLNPYNFAARELILAQKCNDDADCQILVIVDHQAIFEI